MLWKIINPLLKQGNKMPLSKQGSKMNSRVITHPDLVEKMNHTLVLVDPDEQLMTNVIFFLQNSFKEYDIYVYLGQNQDMEYLKTISDRADSVFISDISQVKILNMDSVIYYGQDTELTNPLVYLEKTDNNA